MDENAKALRKQIKKRQVQVDDGTVVTFVSQEANGLRYTYAALYVADSWWLTGVADWFGRRLTNEEFLELAASGKVEDVKVATQFETVK